MTFENALQQLEKTVHQLESGDVTLDQALELFESGVAMSRLCAKHLEDAEHKVELLLNVSEDGRAETAPFDTQTLED